MPAFNSDEVLIPSFIEKGVSEEDAYNYSAIGCIEVAVSGLLDMEVGAFLSWRVNFLAEIF